MGTFLLGHLSKEDMLYTQVLFTRVIYTYYLHVLFTNGIARIFGMEEHYLEFMLILNSESTC